MTQIKEHEPLGLVDQLKSALGNYVGRDGQVVSWLTHCNSASDLFSRGKTPEHLQRFWLPIPLDGRNRKQDSQVDLRPVVVELIDYRKLSDVETNEAHAVLQIRADGVVVDDLYGSIGLIQFCYPNGSAAHDKTTLPAFVLKTVREAMGLRSQLLHRAENGRAYFVELVLVIPSIDSGSLQQVGKTLRQIMAETGYLNAIGVNVLSVDQAASNIGFRDRLHRAFSWLLFHSSRWFKSVAVEREKLFKAWLASDSNSEETSKLKRSTGRNRSTRLTSLCSLKTVHFRHAGTREWKPASDCPLHVIHGFNGTGKSTIVDALELLLTNRIQRVDRGLKVDQFRYDDVLRNRDLASNIQSRVVVGLEDRAMSNAAVGIADYVVTGNGLEPVGGAKGSRSKAAITHQLDKFRSRPETGPGCFRLEQSMSDQMTTGTEAQRAAVILESFFPDSNTKRDLLLNFNQRLESTIIRLRKVWPECSTVELLKDLFAKDTGSVNLKSLNTRLKVFRNEVSPWYQVLSINSEDVKAFETAAVAFWGKEWVDEKKLSVESGMSDGVVSDDVLDRVCEELNEAWRHLPSQAERLLHLNETLQSVFSWQCGGRFTSGTREEQTRLVTDWLTSHVQHDLTLRFHQLCQVAHEHPGQSSEPAPEIAKMVEDVHLDSLQKRLSDFHAERERYWQELVRFRPESVGEVVSAMARPNLSALGLREVDFWIRSEPPLSELIQAALRTDEPQVGTYEGQTIIVGKGDRSSGTAVLDAVKKRQATAEKLNGLKWRSVGNVAEFFRCLADLSGLCEERERLDEKTIRDLEQHLSSDSHLALALNELLALLTPARWAYDDVVVKSSLQNSEASVGFSAGRHSVSQILNTAELNALAISLFLLCAPRIPNPLNLLLLDDPLQNMDEVTVTAVARAIDRVMQLWRSP